MTDGKASRISIVDTHARDTFGRLLAYLNDKNAAFVRSEGGLFILVGGRRIAINHSIDNTGMAGLLLEAADVGSLTLLGRLVIQRMQVHAAANSQEQIDATFAKFDKNRFFLPIDETRMVSVTRDGLQVVSNGQVTETEYGTRRIWVRHPHGKGLLVPALSPENVQSGCAAFEKLLVEPQACEESLKWLVAMHCGFAPYIREALSVMPILVVRGSSGSGKTTGAGLFSLLHGSGVLGDYSVAALSRRDEGFVVLDNKEQCDITPALENYLIFAATGASWGRADRDGSVHTSQARPVVALTTIEGLTRHELKRRCIEIVYDIQGPYISRDRLEEAVKSQRQELMWSIAYVLQTYLATQATDSVAAVPGFEDYFRCLCRMLRAFGRCAGKGDQWADGIVRHWRTLVVREEAQEDLLEYLVVKGLLEGGIPATKRRFERDGTQGTLFTTSAAPLLESLLCLKACPRNIPLSASGLSYRLRSIRPQSFRLIEAKDEPSLRRTAKCRPLGIFIPDSEHNRYSELLTGQRNGNCKPSLSVIRNRDHTQLGRHQCFYIWDWPDHAQGNTHDLLMCLKGMGTGKTAAGQQERQEEAIKYIAGILGEVASSPQLGSGSGDTSWVPMPSTSNDDNRMCRLLNAIEPALPVSMPLHVRELTKARDKSISVAERRSLLEVDNRQRMSGRVILVDDVICTGTHFTAAADALENAFPGICVIGLFLFRRPAKQELHRSASA